MKSEDLRQILELRESDDDVSEGLPKRSLGWRVTLMLIVLAVLAFTFAPMGIMALLYLAGIRIGGGIEQSIVGGFLMVSTLIGLVSIGASNPRVFRYVFWILFGLALLNAGGCAVMLDGLSNIH